jgi:hypothetical protein
MKYKMIFGILSVLLVASASLPSFAWGYGGGWRAQHPRRAEVLGRSNNIMNRINYNRGDLSGHYGQLRREDQSVRRQEQRDARMNGGYITRGEQAHLNREENHINRQIRRDQF